MVCVLVISGLITINFFLSALFVYPSIKAHLVFNICLIIFAILVGIYAFIADDINLKD